MNTPIRQSGFTLHELLVVAATTTVLLSLAAPTFSDFATKRKVAGAAHLISMFIEETKLLAVKRNEFATITIKKAETGNEWCLGATIGNETTCDCLAEVPVCLVDASPMMLTHESYPEFEDLEATFVDSSITFDPVRGILTDPSASFSMEVRDKVDDYRVTIQINGTGGIRKCSPSDKQLVGYQACI